MNTTIKLSVSSVLLAGFMTGCSQQQFQGGGQQVAGGSQLVGGQQVAGGQVAGSQQVVGGQQSVGMDSQIQERVVLDTHSHNLVQSNTHSHNVHTQQRVYVPLPKALAKTPPPVVMFEQPKPIAQHPTVRPHPKPIYKPKPVHQPKQVYKPRPMHKPQQAHKAKPVVQHRGIGLPPAQPGQCFAKVKQPAKFKNIVKRVQLSPAVNKRVKVRGPQYTWVNKKVQVRPASHRFQYIPAQYKTITKRVLVKPAHYTWQKGKNGPVTRIDNMTGEILCRVKVPAVYRNVTQKVVARPAQRIKRPVPAVYKTIKQKKFVSPALYKTIKTPARFTNKTYRVKVSDVRYQWKPIACKKPTAVRKPVQMVSHKPAPKVSAAQQKLAQEFQQQQHELKQQWMQQEAQRQRAAQHRKLAQQRQQAQLEKQRQARIAQQQAQQQLAAHKQPNHQQPAYAAPKPKVTQVAHRTQTTTPVAKTPKVQPKVHQAPAHDTVTPLTRANAVYRIQKALQQRGFNPGDIDGRLGPSTVKALTAFQESQGLKTGTLNRDTLRALNLVR